MVSTLESGGDESRRMEEGNALGREGGGIKQRKIKHKVNLHGNTGSVRSGEGVRTSYDILVRDEVNQTELAADVFLSY